MTVTYLLSLEYIYIYISKWFEPYSQHGPNKETITLLTDSRVLNTSRGRVYQRGIYIYIYIYIYS